MKIKNKKTGEIRELPDGFFCGDNLKKICEEWEDAPEEPEEYWYINEFGTPTKADFVGRETLYDKCRKNFSNYFKTEEEAELAVRKLKAFKWLKDKGFRFDGYHISAGEIHFNMEIPREVMGEFVKDMDICFGGEE